MELAFDYNSHLYVYEARPDWYDDFLEACEAAIAELGLEGELQVASFHPRYQFADTQPEDIENFTNRSPYPMLHLLREASVARAVAAIADPATVFAANLATLDRLGAAGWAALQHQCAADGEAALGNDDEHHETRAQSGLG